MITMLKAYKTICNQVAEAFASKYFCEDSNDSPETWWVAETPGGTYYVNDTFWNMEDMVLALESGIDGDELMEWYFLNTSPENEGNRISLKDWIKGLR